jgi:hypothetical protein
VADSRIGIAVVNGPRWMTRAVLRTDRDGAARTSARLLSTTTLAAVFDGAGALRASLADAAARHR